MLTLVFWDVQHGSAAYIKTPNGKHIVVDLGTGSYSDDNLEFSPLLHLKNKWNVKQLDGVIITHPHRDHLDDILNFGELKPKVLVRPKHLNEDEIRAGNRKEDTTIIDKYLEVNSEYVHPVSPSENPFLDDNNGGVRFVRFIPSSCATSNLNNHSVVTIVSYAKSKIIIPGDNEPPSWNELLEQEEFLTAIKDTDILVAPHHGRDSGFSSALFEYINPRLTIISDGRFCDTSATDRYAKHTKGWTVYKRSGGKEERKCVTTRNDGVIVVKFGMNSNERPFIEVTID
ncbi:competence protein ComEC [Desulfofundulus luciae]|uniref:Competence protein ComEC n=1 Tax=Desulfofundulus luciae TaxID=74702 RepID=A0ABU0B0Q7_9FIRM|nr:MBL fold metallo-hydrolase [Desulfofundulus luciae]MDQ0286290.1 competence protein ComEC [Desulfofundulus luciae]